MTAKQKTILKYMGDNAGSFLRMHITPTGRVCYRLMDFDRSPVCNVQSRSVRKLLSLNKVLQAGPSVVVLNTM